MFVIKSYNTSTGHVETVSGKIPDMFNGDKCAEFRRKFAEEWAREDSSDTHVYYADAI